MRYFAYGSNMDPHGMAVRAPGARALGAARLPGWRLTFARVGADGAGVWHIERSDEDEVWGVLWEATEADLRSLDDYESVSDGEYVRDWLTVTLFPRTMRRPRPGSASEEATPDGNDVEAIVYLAMAHGKATPTSHDVSPLVRGAEAHRLPADYVERIRRLA